MNDNFQLCHIQNSAKIEGSIDYLISRPQFSTLPSDIMLHSMQLPVLQCLKVVSTVHQINNKSTPIPISACEQTFSIKKSTHSSYVLCFINTVQFKDC